MRKIALALAILGTTLTTALYTAPAHAQATRTWVSGVGDDANPCSRTAPCKTWAGAISKTAPGGEIDALDPGGFGGLTITKSITLDGGGGQVASTLVAGTNGIVVVAGTTDVVIIKNIRFQGLLGNGSNPGGAGINGISISTAAEVVIENCEIYGFNNNGINVALTATGVVQVDHSQLFNNKANAISASASSGSAVVQVKDSSIAGGTPFASEGGITAGANSFVEVVNTNFADVSYGTQTLTGGSLFVDSSSFAGISNAILTAAGTTAGATNNSIFGGTAFGGSGTVNSAGNNKLSTTTTQGTATLTVMNQK